jgi:hypothetical protein
VRAGMQRRRPGRWHERKPKHRMPERSDESA